MKTTDKVCGIDRYKASSSFGELIVETILLWKRPNCEMKAGNLTGALAHGSEVEVLEWRGGKAKVVAIVEGNIQTGWLRTTLLEEAGLKEQGISKAYAH
jgi:hypothetical protein